MLLVSAATAYGQKGVLFGKITDEEGKRIPFVSVYLGDSVNTVANERGEYRISANSGTHQVVFRFVGYKKLSREIKISSEELLNVQLEPDIQLKEEDITSGNEELVYAIVRKIISKRRLFLKESSFFTNQVYTKAVQKLVKTPKRILGEDVAKTLSLDSTNHNILFQSETLSKLYVRGDERKELMVATNLAGENQGLNFNRALDLQVNFYNNLIQWDAISKNSFVSPVADNAFSYYNYEYAGSFAADGRIVYKIKVIPQKRFDPVFSGYIYVLSNEWRLYAVDLRLTEDARIDFIDALRISQQYIQLEKNIWQPSDIAFNFNGRFLGFEFAGYMFGVYRNYQLNPKIPVGFFNDEIVKIPEDAAKKKPSFWANSRPVPLTWAEELSYELKDSLEARKQTKEYLDSVQQVQNKFYPLRFAVSGYRRENLFNKSYWYFYPLHNSVFYNTVEGWGVNLKAQYGKQYSYKRSLEIAPNFRYGSSSKTFNANVEVTYRYDSLKHASFTFKGGRDFLDLNNRGTINLFYNTLSTLFKGRNYLKLYRSDFASFRTQREIIDGLQITAGAELARRYPVKNSSYQNIFDNAKETLTSNNPLIPSNEVDLFPVNNAFVVEGKASYTFGQKYTTKPDGKVYEDPRYPTVQVDYRKGIKGFLGSAVDYDFVSMDIFQDKIKIGLLGYSSFYVSAGKFLNTRNVYFPDLRHFTGNQTAVYNPFFPNFHFLDYYSFSTMNKYWESHFEHNFAGLLLNKVPLIRKLKLEEIIGGAYLGQPERNYREVYIGFQKLVFRVDYGYSWTTGRKAYKAFRIFYGF